MHPSCQIPGAAPVYTTTYLSFEIEMNRDNFSTSNQDLHVSIFDTFIDTKKSTIARLNLLSQNRTRSSEKLDICKNVSNFDTLI